MRRLLVALAAVAVTACAAVPSTDASGTDLTVFAAASLNEAFTAVAAAFEAGHPDVEVTLNLAGSPTLATQLVAGAPADVFAAADPVQMQRVADAGRVAEAHPFAGNALVIAVEAGNPLGIASLHDLARDDVLLVLAADTVPAGAYAAAALEAAGVAARPVSLEPDVRAALGKVVLGEADAAIVYGSDVAAALPDRVEAIPIAPTSDLEVHYPVATIRDTDDPAAAASFVAFLRGPTGRALLRDRGFTAP